MDGQRYQQIYDLFSRLRQEAPEQRGSALAKACREDPELRRDVETLLADDAEPPPAQTLTAHEIREALAEYDKRLGEQTGTPAVRVGLKIEGYEILREIHRGGQGVVYQAVQQSTKRKVAIKVLLAGPYASPSSKRRFEREIELVAQLKHRNIAAVFHSGLTPDGYHYCVMDYIRGVPLNHYVLDHKLPLEEALKLVADVCDAVNYAHQRGVIHRDLKPSNILVDAQGQPKLLDFGLAKMVSGPEETLVSVTGQVVGTLPYMSPEQARGNPDEIDIRTDVYALGVIFYELLTGHYPYPVSGQIAEVLKHIVETPPAPPSRLWNRNSGITRRSSKSLRTQHCPIDDEMQTVVLKALAKERERRYQSAGELARDINHYLSGEAIEAKGDSSWYLMRKFLACRRPQVGLSVAVLACAAASVLFFYQRHQTQALRRANEVQLTKWLLGRGMYDQALSNAESLLEDDSRALDINLLRVRALFQTGRLQEAEELLVQLLEAHPQAASIHGLLAKMTETSDPERSKHHAAQARRYEVDSARDLYLRSLSEPHDSAASILLSRALDHDPAFFDALMARTSRYYRLKNFAEARIDAERARTLRPGDPRAWYNLGTALFRLQDYERAAQALQRTVALQPEFASGWFNLGMVLDSAGQPEQAAQAYERSLQLNSEQAPAWNYLGRFRFKQRQYPKARTAFERALEIRPDYFDARYHLALCHVQLGDYDQAVPAFQECLKTNKYRQVVLPAMADAQYRAGHPRQALDTLQQALAIKPDDANSLNLAAWILLTMSPRTQQDCVQALAYAQHAYSARPEDRNILGTLALAEVRSGQFKSALEHAEESLQPESNDAWTMLAYAWAAFELGHTQKALAMRRRALVVLSQDQNPEPALQAFATKLDNRFEPLIQESES